MNITNVLLATSHWGYKLTPKVLRDGYCAAAAYLSGIALQVKALEDLHRKARAFSRMSVDIVHRYHAEVDSVGVVAAGENAADACLDMLERLGLGIMPPGGASREPA